MRRLIGVAIRAYRLSPLYPAWGPRLARLLSVVQGAHTRPFIHDVGSFKMQLDVSQLIDSQIYYAGDYEPEAVRTVTRLVRPGDVAIDVGANVGWITLTLAARVGQTGQVIAFEPTEWAFRRLEANLALNQFTHVRPERLGVSDVERRTPSARIRSSYRVDGRLEMTPQEIDLVTLDRYLAAHPVARVDFIKIDTDGMEAHVVRGACETLRRFRPAILFELGPDNLTANGGSAEALLALLGGLGYEFFEEGSLQPARDLPQVVRAVPREATMNLVALPADAVHRYAR